MKKYMPKYIQIYSYLLSQINDGTYSQGEKIPSEIDIAAQFKVSRLTVSKAIKELENEKIVKRVQGVGTFVSETLESSSFFHALRETSKVTSEIHEFRAHKTISIDIIDANDNLQKKLSLNSRDRVYKVVRYNYRKKNGSYKNIAIDTSFIPCKYLKNEILKENFDDCYLHEFMKKNSTVSGKKLHIKMDTKLSDTEESSILDVPLNYPLLLCETCIINEIGKMIATTFSVADPKSYKAYVNYDIK